MGDEVVEEPVDRPGAVSADRAEHDGGVSGRSVGAAVLLLLSVLALAVTLPSHWVQAELLDRGSFADSATPLVRDRAMTAYLEGRLTAGLSKAYGSPQAGAATALDDAVKAEVTDPGFEARWRSAVEAAHPQVREAVVGSGTSGGADAGKVFVDLRPTAQRVVDALASDPRFATRPALDPDELRVSLLNLHSFQGSRSATKSMVDLRWLWAAVAVVGLAGGLAVARRRLRALTWWAVGALLVLAAELPVIAAGRSAYLDKLGRTSLPEPVAADLLDSLSHALRQQLTWGAIAAAVVAVIALVLSLSLGRPRRGRHARA